jgi:hypothetical protein
MCNVIILTLNVEVLVNHVGMRNDHVLLVVKIMNTIQPDSDSVHDFRPMVLLTWPLE